MNNYIENKQSITRSLDHSIVSVLVAPCGSTTMLHSELSTGSGNWYSVFKKSVLLPNDVAEYAEPGEYAEKFDE